MDKIDEKTPLTKRQAKGKIKKLLWDAEREHEYGGGESANGSLSYGWINFEELQDEIMEIMDRVVVGDVNEKLIEQEADWLKRLKNNNAKNEAT